MNRKLIPLLTPLFLASASLVANANSIPSQPTSASTGQPGNSPDAQGKEPQKNEDAAITKPNTANVFGSGPSNPDTSKKGPWTGKGVGKKQGGQGGWSPGDVNPGQGSALTPKGDQIGAKDTVPTPPAIKNESLRKVGETDSRKSPRVGTGNTADNDRLDPNTGTRMLPNTMSSSNPANPNAPLAPGGAGHRGGPQPLRGEQNSGAYADMALPVYGGNPQDIAERARSLTINFDQGQAKLDKDGEAKIMGLLSEARAAGSISEVKVISWGDVNGGPNDKLPKKEIDLAKQRADAIRSFVSNKTTDTKISELNMAKDAGLLEKVFGGSNKLLRERITSAGLSGQPGSKASLAMVMVIMKR